VMVHVKRGDRGSHKLLVCRNGQGKSYLSLLHVHWDCSLRVLHGGRLVQQASSGCQSPVPVPKLLVAGCPGSQWIVQVGA